MRGCASVGSTTPYFQYFTGEVFFQHAFPHERSDLSHWRKRLGDKLELLLAESLRVAHEAGALRGQDLKRVTVDTTVQPKAITFPTDAKLLHAAIKGLNRLARKHGVRLRQSYLRIAKTAAMMAGRYAHAKQFKRHQRQLRILRSRLGRIIRDIRRKIEGQTVLENAFALPLGRASQIRSQQQRQRGWKLYSFHAPEVECIGKGKAAAPYEFGVKASFVTNNRRAPGGLFVLHVRALPDNPYDGHTLRDVIDRTETLTGCAIERAYVDKGYRGHDTQNPRRIFISGQEARRLRCHQARAAPPLRHRTHHRTPEDRWPPRPLLSQRPRWRCGQRHPLCRRPQLPPHPRLAQRTLVPVPDPALAHARLSGPAQFRFLTDDYLTKLFGFNPSLRWASFDGAEKVRGQVLSLRHPTKIVSYLEPRTGQKFGLFPAFPRAENSHSLSKRGPKGAGEPNFLRILAPPKLV
ncbi:hypothetical protein ACVWW2_002949 [Bradyrhizobium sp. LM4.3]